MSAGAWGEVVAVAHGLLVLFVVGGGFLAWWRPGVRRWHLPVLAAAAAVNVTGSPCPLTVLERRLRAAAGRGEYAGGFLEHYVVEPLLGLEMTATVSRLVLAVAVVPNLLAYGLPLLRVAHRRAAAPATPRAAARAEDRRSPRQLPSSER